MFFCIIPCPLWILSSSLFSFSCFFFLKNKKTKRIFISLQIVIQTGLVEIGEDSERPLAIIETHTDSGLGKKRFLNTTLEEVLNTIHTATSEGFPVKIIATFTCVYFLIFLSSIVGYSFVLWLCYKLKRQRESPLTCCIANVAIADVAFTAIYFWLDSILMDLGWRRNTLLITKLFHWSMLFHLPNGSCSY